MRYLTGGINDLGQDAAGMGPPPPDQFAWNPSTGKYDFVGPRDTKPELPSWVLPVGLGVGALLLFMSLKGK